MSKIAKGERKENILNSAERLFAQKGFEGVTVREVTNGAGVDVALVNYYFNSKRGLFDAVLMRRADVLNKHRMESLAACEREAGDKPLTIEAIIDAYTHPLLDRSDRGGPGWKSYFSLIAQVNNSPEWGDIMLPRYFDPIVRRFMEALRKALPDSSEENLFWCYHFLSGALTLTFAETGRIDHLSNGLCKSKDLEAVHARLVPFVTAGFNALCNKDNS